MIFLLKNIKMSSGQRQPSQRPNNTVTAVIPGPKGTWYGQGGDYYQELNIDPRYSSVFTVDMSNLTASIGPDISYNGGVFTNPKIFYFTLVTDPKIAKNYPGLEFTINFVNCKAAVSNSNPANPAKVCIDFYTDKNNGDILSTPEAMQYFNSLNVTLKSNGEAFVVTGSGPVAWSLVAYDN